MNEDRPNNTRVVPEAEGPETLLPEEIFNFPRFRQLAAGPCARPPGPVGGTWCWHCLAIGVLRAAGEAV